MRKIQLLMAAVILLGFSVVTAEDQPIVRSNIAGKKLLRISQALTNHTSAADVPARIKSWQQTGYDGVCFNLEADVASSNSRLRMTWRWWDVDSRKREEFATDIKAFKSVKDWGRLTDNFLWMGTHAKGHKPPDWFNDQDWQIVLANARLGASIAKEIGFKGIAFDVEGYGGGAYGVWRQPFDYSLYARGDYKIEGRVAPRPFVEVVQKVRQRGRQWAQAISGDYPDIRLLVLPGLYDAVWPRVTEQRFGGDLAKCDMGLFPAFVDGMLEGLDKRALIVSLCESTYIESRYSDLLVHRNIAKEQSLMISAVPKLARQRISFAAGIWTDAGYGTQRFSNTDARHNQREPKRHMHAVHNTLAVSDHYAWQWGEWGNHGESNWMTTDPTPLIRQYWQANIDARQPQNLQWEPQPHHDNTDYARANATAAKAEATLWDRKQQQGYKVAVALPRKWKFRLDLEMLARYRNYGTFEYDDSSWYTMDCTTCWQSQGTKANEVGIYRVKFVAPADLDGTKQEILLVFGGLGSGTGHIYFNGRWISYAKQAVDVSKTIRPGQANLVHLVFQNKSGPGGLMGRVKLLVRNKKSP